MQSCSNLIGIIYWRMSEISKGLMSKSWGVKPLYLPALLRSTKVCFFLHLSSALSINITFWDAKDFLQELDFILLPIFFFFILLQICFLMADFFNGSFYFNTEMFIMSVVELSDENNFIRISKRSQNSDLPFFFVLLYISIFI